MSDNQGNTDPFSQPQPANSTQPPNQPVDGGFDAPADEQVPVSQPYQPLPGDQPQYAQQQYGQPQYAQPQSTSGMAIASLVTSLVGFGLIGVILGHIALSGIKKTGQSGRGMAIAGLVIGYIGIAAGILFAIWFFSVLSAGLYYY